MAATLIGLLTEEGDLVLDPFGGSGTVLVEAQRLDRLSLGFELNPISCEITRAKTMRLNGNQIEKAVARLLDDVEWALDGRLGHVDAQSQVPPTVQTKWYTKRVLEDLGLIWSLVQSYQSADRTISEVCFSSILLPACRETRHWGYVCDNTMPKDNHSPSVRHLFVQALERVVEAYRGRDVERSALKRKSTVPEALLRQGDARELVRKLDERSINAVVTSPPYFGVSDYTKSQRLSMEWFGQEIEPLRKNEIGARSKRHRKTAAADYIDELAIVLGDLQSKLTEDGMLALIIGESPSRRLVVDELLERLLVAGYTCMFEKARRVSDRRRQNPSVLEERIIVLTAK